MTPIADGLLNGERKVIERLQNQQGKPGKAAQVAASIAAQARVTLRANAQTAYDP